MTYDEANTASVHAFTLRIRKRGEIEAAAQNTPDRDTMARLWAEYDLVTAEEASLRAKAMLLFLSRDEC